MWFLEFIRDFIATPAILVGIFAFLGSIILREKFTKNITVFFKTAAGFFILGGGAAILIGPLNNFQVLFQDGYHLPGVIPNNDAFAGWLVGKFANIAQLGSLIMVVSMIFNLILAWLGRWKYVYLSGHVLFYMSIMLAGLFGLSGFDFTNSPGDFALALFSGALILGLYMVLSPALTKRHVQMITGTDNISMAHTGSLTYIMSGYLGELIHKLAKGKVKSTESFKFPKGLSFFRNTFISISITMMIFFAAVYIPVGIMYEIGKANPSYTQYQFPASVNQILSSKNWLVTMIVDALTFAAGIEVLLMGVRLIIGELVPSFKGISEKVIKNAKAGLDCPIVFPYAPNAVLIGFVSSFVGGLIGLAISIGISYASPVVNLNGARLVSIILPGIIPHFFLGATCGVFGNVKGGILGAVVGAFLNGIIISFVPIIFMAGRWSELGAGLGWGDSDYLIGIFPGVLGKIGLHNPGLSKGLILGLSLGAYLTLILDGILDRFVKPYRAFWQKMKAKIIPVKPQTNPEPTITIPASDL